MAPARVPRKYAAMLTSGTRISANHHQFAPMRLNMYPAASASAAPAVRSNRRGMPSTAPARRVTAMAVSFSPHGEEPREARRLEPWPGVWGHPSRRALWALLRMRFRDEGCSLQQPMTMLSGLLAGPRRDERHPGKARGAARQRAARRRAGAHRCAAQARQADRARARRVADGQIGRANV